jgi:hypothetical protein
VFTDIEALVKKESAQEKEEEMIELSFVHNGKKINKTVAKGLTITLLKQELIKTVPGLSKETQESISLLVEGTRLDSNKRVKDLDFNK